MTEKLFTGTLNKNQNNFFFLNYLIIIIAYIFSIPNFYTIVHLFRVHVNTEKERRVWFIPLDRAFGSIQSIQSQKGCLLGISNIS